MYTLATPEPNRVGYGVDGRCRHGGMHVRHRTPSILPRIEGRGGRERLKSPRHAGFSLSGTRWQARTVWDHPSRVSRAPMPRHDLFPAGRNPDSIDLPPCSDPISPPAKHAGVWKTGQTTETDSAKSGFQATFSRQALHERAIQPGLFILATSSSLYNRAPQFARGNHPARTIFRPKKRRLSPNRYHFPKLGSPNVRY